MTMVGWPQSLLLVRHGESTGNVANNAAYAAHAEALDLDLADPQVPLSDLGVRQATALGRRLGELPDDERPQRIVVSPYLRAQQTAEHVLAAAGWDDLPRITDERLRDREQGIVDRLTFFGIQARLPAEAARRAALGKFYYRPPGGESWADVALRIRSLLQDLRLDNAGERLMAVTHDVPILMVRYVVEGLSPAEAVALSGQVVNCGLTAYGEGAQGLMLDRFNDPTPVEDDPHAEVTAHD
jgi:broad specificity phosphatase PhoE